VAADPVFSVGVLEALLRFEQGGGAEVPPAVAMIPEAFEQARAGRWRLGPEALAEVTRLLSARGWSPEQGARYAAGVAHAVETLRRAAPPGAAVPPAGG
jgi:hypothetical protein